MAKFTLPHRRKGPVYETPLEVFVESGGTEFPADIVDWDILSTRVESSDDFIAKTCAMCRVNPVDLGEHTVRTLKIEELPYEIAVRVCESCDYEMDLAEAASSMNMDNISKPYKLRVSTDSDLSELTDELVRVVEQNEKLTNTVIERYKQGKPVSRDPEHGRCYFCLKVIEDEPPIPMYLPIDKNSAYYGATNLAHVCEECYEKTDYNVERHYIGTDVCPSCGAVYPVGDEELDLRSMQNTLGKHLCSVCFMQNHGTVGLDRFIYYPCKECKGTDVVDRTIYASHKDLPDLYNYTCNKCKSKTLMGESALLEGIGAESYSVMWTDDIQVKVFTTLDGDQGKKIFYMILRKKLLGSEDRDNYVDNFWEVIYREKNPSENVFSAVQEGLNMCQSLFRHEIRLTM